nr:MAG TPA: hypothetical protein [Crassvirales sp.]
MVFSLNYPPFQKCKGRTLYFQYYRDKYYLCVKHSYLLLL